MIPNRWNIGINLGPRVAHYGGVILSIRRPLTSKLSEISENNSPKILTFEGIRSEESPKRSIYTPIFEAPKNITQINARPVLYWSSLEVFLYIFAQNLPLNPMYRYGYSRVGCVVCPYTSKWGDYISSLKMSEISEPYVSELQKMAASNGVLDVEKFINEGEWKKRVGGKYLNINSNKVSLSSNKEEISVKLLNPSSDFISWLRALTKVIFHNDNGTFEFQDKIFTISRFGQNSQEIYKIYGEITNDILFPIKRIANKAAYCIRCGSCETVCPEGALTITSKKLINEKKCNHCLKCINYVEKDAGQLYR